MLKFTILLSSVLIAFPLIRLMTNKLMALFNTEGTKGKQSLRKTNILKIILGKNKDYIE